MAEQTRMSDSYTFVVNDSSFDILDAEHKLVRRFAVDKGNQTGFGRSIRLYYPLLLVSEPLNDRGGAIWVFRFGRDEFGQLSVRLIHKVFRPVISEITGFGKCFYYHAPHLVILDPLFPDFQGCVWAGALNTNIQLAKIYEHKNTPECLTDINQVSIQKGEITVKMTIMNRMLLTSHEISWHGHLPPTSLEQTVQ